MTTAAHQSAADLPQTSLYVGDLHPRVSEATLYAKFAECGMVASVRVCRDVGSKDSLGYGYVNFQDPKDAERALENMNYEMLEGRPIRIMWSQRDPSLRKSGLGNIFIKNLDKTIEQKELFDTFNFFGNILSCKIATDELGNSKGYGFVHFESEECALRAIEKVNNMSICDRIVYVGKFIPSSDRKSKSARTKFNNCYVKNFGTEMDDEKLRELFQGFGEIKSACVMKDESGNSKGFGFVCFEEPESAERAVRTLNGKELHKRELYVNRAQRREERQEELRQRAEKQRQERQSKYEKGVNLYVKNLDDALTDEQLKKAFASYGVITSAKVMTDQNGRSKGFGFVCFALEQDAAKAVSEMNAALVGTKPLYVAIAQRKEDRRAKLLAEHQQRLQQYRTAINNIMTPASAHPNAANYFTSAAFAQPQRYYPPPQVLSQPKWNRSAAGMTMGLPTAHHTLSGVSNPRANPMTSHYPVSGPPTGIATHAQLNHAAAAMANAGGVGAFRQQQHQVGAGRGMVPGGAGLQSVLTQGGPRGPPTVGMSMPQQQQIMNPTAGIPQRPSMASVVAAAPGSAGIKASMAAVAGQMGQPRPMQQQGGMQPGQQAPNAVRYAQTARNVIPTQQQQQIGAAVAAQQQPATSSMTGLLAGDHGPMSLSKLASLSEDSQKELLGNKLYPLINLHHPQMAAKLTGMLLQMDIPEVIHMLDSKEALKAKLDEAIGMIRSRAEAPQAEQTTEGASGDTKNASGKNDGAKGAKHINSETK